MPELVPLEKAAAAEALYERLGNQKAVGDALGMPRETVRDIINGHNRWSEVRHDASYTALRLEQKRILQVAGTKLMSQALTQIEKRLPDASAPQAAMVYGILFDKDRLMAGASTQNIGVRTSNEISNLDSLADALRGELIKRKSP